MFDAAVHGRPSIVNSGCLMGDVVKAEKLGGVVETGNPAALKKVIETFMHDKIAKIKLDRTWSGEAQRLIAAYDKFGNGS